MLNCPHWQFAQTVVLGIFIIQYVASAVTIAENWRLKKLRAHKTLLMNGNKTLKRLIGFRVFSQI
jgi:hypothetical protein